MLRFRQYLDEATNGLRKKIGLEFVYGSRSLLLKDVAETEVKSEDGELEKKNFNLASNAEIFSKNKKNKWLTLFTFEDAKKKKDVYFFLFTNKSGIYVAPKKLGMKIKGGVESLNLKPQKFGIKELMSYTDFVKALRLNIGKRKDLGKKIQNYLTYLIDDSEGKKVSPPDITNLPIAQIGKNFGELSGPIKLFNCDIYSQKFSKPNDQIVFPLSGNFKLLDYGIKEKNGVVHNFSAKYKSGAATSLGSVYDIIKDKSKQFGGEWKQRADLIKIISENSQSQGVIKLAMKLDIVSTKQKKLWDDEVYEDDEFDFFKQTLSPHHPEKAIPYFWILAGIAVLVAEKLNELYDWDAIVRKAMAIVNVYQISMYIDSKGVPSYKINIANDTDLGTSKKFMIDAKKSFWSTGNNQRLSFKLN